MGLFGNLFDVNGDGKLDTFERAAEFATFTGILAEEEAEEEMENAMLDLDLENLEMMDEDERREALEDAGYDPDEFADEFGDDF